MTDKEFIEEAKWKIFQLTKFVNEPKDARMLWYSHLAGNYRAVFNYMHDHGTTYCEATYIQEDDQLNVHMYVQQQ